MHHIAHEPIVESRPKMKKIYIIVFIMLLISVATTVGSENRTDAIKPENGLVFATPQNEGIFTNYMTKVFQEVGNRIFIDCTIIELPKKRCLSDSNKGLYDGVAARVMGLESIGYNNLIRIKVSHFTVQHIVFSLTIRTFYAHNLARLIDAAKKENFTIGYLQGSKKAAELLADLPAKNKIALDLPEHAFRMLGSGRISAYLAGPGIVNRAILKELKTNAPDNLGLQDIEELFIASESELFPYLHMKHDNLVPVLEKALNAMKADGTIDKLYRELWNDVKK